jgi:hypothetical protein
MARSNVTPQSILASAPANASNEATCATFFAKCERWASIELYEPIRQTAWLGIKELDRLCKRDLALTTLKTQLQAYIDIYSTEEVTPADLNPSEPNIGNASSTMTLTWPTEGQAATTPVLPPKEGL